MSRRTLALLVALALALGLAFQPAPASAFLKQLIKPVVQTFSLSIRRGNAYERLEANRDREVEAVRQRAQIAEWHAQRGWIDEAALQQERARHQAWAEGVVQRTEREKRMTRDSFGRAVGVVWRNAAVDALTQGLSPRNATIARGIAKGDHPLRAALDGLTASIGGDGVPPDSLDQLREQWGSTREALRSIRLPGAVSLDQRLADIIARSDRLREGPAGVGEAVFAQEIEALRRAATETQALVVSARAAIADWTVASAGVNASRFANDARWQELAAAIAEVSGHTAGKALLAGMLRSSEIRITAAIAETGSTLDEDAIARIIATVAAEAAAERVAAVEAGESVLSVDLDAVVARVLAEYFAVSGADPEGEDGEDAGDEVAGFYSGDLTLVQCGVTCEAFQCEIVRPFRLALGPTGGVAGIVPAQSRWTLTECLEPLEGGWAVTGAWSSDGHVAIELASFVDAYASVQGEVRNGTLTLSLDEDPRAGEAGSIARFDAVLTKE